MVGCCPRVVTYLWRCHRLTERIAVHIAVHIAEGTAAPFDSADRRDHPDHDNSNQYSSCCRRRAVAIITTGATAVGAAA